MQTLTVYANQNLNCTLWARIACGTLVLVQEANLPHSRDPGLVRFRISGRRVRKLLIVEIQA